MALPLAKKDVLTAKNRLAKEADDLRGEVGKIDKKLGNEQFLAKAPPEVVDTQKERRAELSEKLARVEAALERLGATS